MPSYTVSFRTFGCRLNQAETENAAAAFTAAGAEVVPFGEAADVVVFNTCTVTSKAEQKARREMRLALRRSPDAVILATGCYAELEGAAVSALAPRVVVLPGSRKGAIVGFAQAMADAHAEGLDPLDEARRYLSWSAGKPADPFFFNPGDSRLRSRAALKIEDGCDNRCTYCRVCIARGRAQSLEPALVLERARVLASSGYPEIVLTGVNLSHYRFGGLDFPALLSLLCRETDAVAFRVSSYEPDRVNDAFLSAFSHPRVQPFLHLALQSGSDDILRSMGRAYRAAGALEAAARAREAKGDPFISADLILGFPGESDDDFSRTMDVLAVLDPAWVHAFTFSPRPGTKAFSMTPMVPERVAAERAAAVAAFAKERRRIFAERRVGTETDAILELPDEDESGAQEVHGFRSNRGLSGDYLRLELDPPPVHAGATVRCKVVGLSHAPGCDLKARPV